MFKDSFKALKGIKRFGDVYMVTAKEKIQLKLSYRVTVCLFVGYPSNHANDVYRLFNLSTIHVIKSRDVIWLNKTYGESIIKR
jgi:hypothetical protein